MAETEHQAGSVSARDIRVSDAEREHVVGLLQKAIGRGLIDLDEFTERADIAYAAATRGELNIVLADLPGLVHRDAPRPGAAPIPLSGDRLELTGHYSTVTRNGRWVVPERLVIRNKYGNTELDFTEAQIGTPVVYVELDTKWGSVEVTIPERAAIDINAITDVKYGSMADKTGSNGKPGMPRIVLSGRVHGGNLTIRNPRHRWRGRG
ncbi:MAG: DUF1707 SHOCT-like domain-containing protein [Haloechinothrix sp.]